ncbi:MAG: hypothetical protein AAGB51_05685 [Planctomycetota bacterium]
MTGLVQSASVQLTSTNAFEVNFAIYEGTGTDGDQLGFTVGGASVANGPFGTEYTGSFGSGAELIAGQVYTLGIEGVTFLGEPAQLRIPVSDQVGYSDGEVSLGGVPSSSEDAFFRIRTFDPNGTDQAFINQLGDLHAEGVVASAPSRVDLGANSIDSEEIFDESGVSGGQIFRRTLVPLDGMPVVISTRAITPPAEGRVLEFFDCELVIPHVQGQQTRVEFNPISGRRIWIPAAAASGTYHMPMSFTGAGFTVAPGSPQQATVEVQATGGGTEIEIINDVHILLYVPTEYD